MDEIHDALAEFAGIQVMTFLRCLSCSKRITLAIVVHHLEEVVREREGAKRKADHVASNAADCFPELLDFLRSLLATYRNLLGKPFKAAAFVGDFQRCGGFFERLLRALQVSEYTREWLDQAH